MAAKTKANCLGPKLSDAALGQVQRLQTGHGPCCSCNSPCSAITNVVSVKAQHLETGMTAKAVANRFASGFPNAT